MANDTEDDEKWDSWMIGRIERAADTLGVLEGAEDPGEMMTLLERGIGTLLADRDDLKRQLAQRDSKIRDLEITGHLLQNALAAAMGVEELHGDIDDWYCAAMEFRRNTDAMVLAFTHWETRRFVRLT